jgi:hypothetical protein
MLASFHIVSLPHLFGKPLKLAASPRQVFHQPRAGSFRAQISAKWNIGHRLWLHNNIGPEKGCVSLYGRVYSLCISTFMRRIPRVKDLTGIRGNSLIDSIYLI